MKDGIINFAAAGVLMALTTSMAFALGEQTPMRIIETQTTFIRHTATEYQRRIAEQNAKAFFKRLPPAKKVELKRKNIKAVLIKTAPSPKTSPKAKEVRMRFELEGETLMSDDVYEFVTPLQAGTIAKPVGLDAEYVGL